MKMRITSDKIKSRLPRIILLVTIYSLLVTLIGCDAFVRKFTRKPKKEDLPREEMVLEPMEYKGPEMSKAELYRQYFLYWRSWQDELIQSLSQNTSHKKQIECVNEAIKNIKQIKTLLSAEKQKQLDIYINQLNELRDLVTKDIYGNNIMGNRTIAERIKRNILRNFSYAAVKDYLI